MTVLEEVKTRLGITGTFHDDLIQAYILDVKAFLSSSGVPDEIIESQDAYGCITRGVADLWNYGNGEGKLSPVFYQRVIQMAYQEVNDDSDGE